MDFDPLLSQLRVRPHSGQILRWAIRNGSTSAHRNDIGRSSRSLGFTVDDIEAERHHLQLTEGTLDATYRATHIAKFNGSPFPVVMTAFRDITPDRRTSYSMELNGLKPVRSYLMVLGTVSIFIAVFFELIDLSGHRKRPSATGL